jgi:site-specific recombinase XerD
MFLVKNNKSAFYQIIYFVDGKKTSHSTKKTTKVEALKYLQNFKVSQTSTPRPIEPIIQEDTAKHSLTLSQFKKEYLEYATPVKSKKYIDSIAYSFKYFIDYAGDIELDKIETRIVDKFINVTFTRTQRGAHLYYRTLKAALNKAVEWNYISLNPFTKVKFPKISKSFPVFISEDELLIILVNTKYEHLKDIITVAFYTGLRIGELVNMNWNWIDFLQNQITVKCSDQFQTKSKKERIVPMSDKVRSILFRRFNSTSHSPDEVVFYRRKGKVLYQESISKQFKKIIRKSNLNDKIHFHTLRHSFASLLVQKGVSLYVVKELLGHEDLATTQIYSHLQKENLIEAVNMF